MLSRKPTSTVYEQVLIIHDDRARQNGGHVLFYGDIDGTSNATVTALTTGGCKLVYLESGVCAV